MPGGSDWSVQAADTIERVVGAIRDKTSVPLVTVVRALVYGVLVAVMGVTTLVFLTVAAVRVVNIVLEVWATYLVLGGIFTLFGLLLLRKATSAKASRESGS